MLDLVITDEMVRAGVRVFDPAAITGEGYHPDIVEGVREEAMSKSRYIIEEALKAADDQYLARLYWNVWRAPAEGTITAGIAAHAAACGLVSYVADRHPEAVAMAVMAEKRRTEVRDG